MLGHLIDISVFVISFERQSQKSNNNSTNKKKWYKNVALKTIVPFHLYATSFALVHEGVHDS